MEKNEILDNFITAIEEIYSGMDPRTFWPLNGGQIDAYFDVDEALDMYYRISKLRNTMNASEIAKLLPEADIIRLFLEHNAIVGLKVAIKLNIVKISPEEIIDYVLFLFEILRSKVQNDIFSLDGKNILIDKLEVNKVLSGIKWDKPSNEEEKKRIAYLGVVANNFCYTLYYDIYMSGGFFIHGPYDAREYFGEDASLLIREYRDINPKEIWPELDMPHKKMKILGVYRNLDLKINFTNHPESNTSVRDKLIAYKIFLDKKEVAPENIEKIIEFLQNKSTEQTKKINALHDLDKVRKGIEIAYYLFKNFREATGDSWRPPKEIENTIQKFKDQFIKKFQYKKIPKLEHWKKLYDPRNDYY